MEVVDLFGREYGWTVGDVRRLSMVECRVLQRIMKQRKAEEREAAEQARQNLVR